MLGLYGAICKFWELSAPPHWKNFALSYGLPNPVRQKSRIPSHLRLQPMGSTNHFQRRKLGCPLLNSPYTPSFFLTILISKIVKKGNVKKGGILKKGGKPQILKKKHKMQEKFSKNFEKMVKKIHLFTKNKKNG